MKRFVLFLILSNFGFFVSAQDKATKEVKPFGGNNQIARVQINAKNTKEINMKKQQALNSTDKKFLEKCVGLAREAYQAGDSPFGSVLVDKNNMVLATARNRVNEKTAMAHPEIELAQWALDNLNKEERRNATMYTSGEHCPMCAGAHAWSQVGRLVFLSSAQQLKTWQEEANMPEAPINFIPSREIIKNVAIDGPYDGELLEEIKKLQFATFSREKSK
ncbi:nucleoside deaminase [Haloflavibacter putidus]|nr:nucleoside deaminase [Haloflavibacter putidus]